MNNTPEKLITEQDEINAELDLAELKENYERQRPKYSEVKWLSIFPEAKQHWGKVILAGLKVSARYWEEQISLIKAQTNKALRENTEAWRDDLIKERGIEKLKEAEKQIRAQKALMTFYHQIGKSPEKIKQLVITDDMIAAAKQYPITELVDVNRAGFTDCFHHTSAKQKTPSLYCKKNFVHCFSCGYSADTIQLLRDRDGITFKEAVLRLQ